MNDNFCVICETQDKQVKAEYFINVNGDLIPVCKSCHKRHKNDKIINAIENEQSSIKGYNKRSNKKA